MGVKEDRENLVGTTYGLTSGSGEGRPEQVYVRRDPKNEARPVRVEGRVGYGTDSRMDLTRDQARELRNLLTTALDEPEETVVLYRLPSPSVDDECPLVPEGATDWEAQEIRSAWRRVHSYAKQAVGSIVYAVQRPAGRSSPGLVTAASQLAAAQVELAARIDGAQHRMSSTRV